MLIASYFIKNDKKVCLQKLKDEEKKELPPPKWKREKGFETDYTIRLFLSEDPQV